MKDGGSKMKHCVLVFVEDGWTHVVKQIKQENSHKKRFGKRKWCGFMEHYGGLLDFFLEGKVFKDVNRNNVVDCEWRWWMNFYGFEWREVGNCCVRYEWIEALYFDFFYFLK